MPPDKRKTEPTRAHKEVKGGQMCSKKLETYSWITMLPACSKANRHLRTCQCSRHERRLRGSGPTPHRGPLRLPMSACSVLAPSIARRCLTYIIQNVVRVHVIAVPVAVQQKQRRQCRTVWVSYIEMILKRPGRGRPFGSGCSAGMIANQRVWFQSPNRIPHTNRSII